MKHYKEQIQQLKNLQPGWHTDNGQQLGNTIDTSIITAIEEILNELPDSNIYLNPNAIYDCVTIRWSGKFYVCSIFKDCILITDSTHNPGLLYDINDTKSVVHYLWEHLEQINKEKLF